MEANDPVGMSVQGFDQSACPPILYLDGMVQASGNQSAIFKLQTPDTLRVAGKCSQHLASLDVPHFDCCVVGASDEDLVVKLEAHDTIGVAFQYAR